MTDENNTVPVAGIELSHHTEARDLHHLLDCLGIEPYELDFNPEPADDEPDFYLTREEDNE